MEFNTGGSILSVVTDISGNNALNVLGNPAPGGGVLRLDFLGGAVASVSADITDATFPVIIEAYGSSGNLLDSSNTGGTSAIPTYETLSLSRAVADIAYVIVHDSGNDYYVDNITYDTSPSASVPAPEPATLLLVGSGLAGLVFAKRRKRNA